MVHHEIVLPITQPETEWIDGHAVQKVSPTYHHALLQRRIGAWLGAWVDESKLGRSGTEWRFRVAPPGEIVRPLVPDVAYLSYDILPKGVSYDELQVPLAAPTVAFEILSPDDEKRNIASKIATLLAAGTQAVVVIDPRNATVTVHDASGAALYAPPDVLDHASMPGFEIALDRLFADMD
jgi:Uma2 family endonuclease